MEADVWKNQSFLRNVPILVAREPWPFLTNKLTWINVA